MLVGAMRVRRRYIEMAVEEVRHPAAEVGAQERLADHDVDHEQRIVVVTLAHGVRQGAFEGTARSCDELDEHPYGHVAHQSAYLTVP